MPVNTRSKIILITQLLIHLVIIPILIILLGLFIDEVLGLPNILKDFLLLRAALSITFLLIGGYLAVDSNIHLWKVGKGYAWGDVSENCETKVLVTTGPYKYMRNPMILGYTLLISAVGLIAGSVSTAIIIPLLNLISESIWIKIVEEPKLEKRFGEEYLNYKKRVPFLLLYPRRRVRSRSRE